MPALDLIAWILLVVWAVLLAGGILFHRSPTPERAIPLWIQIASSATLLILAWYGYLLTRAGADSARYALGIAGGMTVCFLGSLFVEGAVSPRRPLRSISASALSHLLCVGAMAQYDALGSVRWLALSLWLGVGAFAGRAVLLRARRRDPLPASVAVAYTLLLTATAGFATGLALTAPLFRVLAVGALLLLFSDLTQLAELAVFPSTAPGVRPSDAGQTSRPLSAIGSAARLLRAPGQALVVVSIWSALQDFA